MLNYQLTNQLRTTNKPLPCMCIDDSYVGTLIMHTECHVSPGAPPTAERNGLMANQSIRLRY